MAAPTMPRAPLHVLPPSTFYYQPWGRRVPFNPSLTESIRDYMNTQGVGFAGVFPEPSYFDMSSPPAEAGPWVESQDTTQNWKVMGDSNTFLSTRFVSSRAEFFPFYFYQGRVFGLTQRYNQGATAYGTGNYGDTHSHAYSRKLGIAQDTYITRDTEFAGYLQALNCCVYWGFDQTMFPTGGKDSNGNFVYPYQGQRIGATRGNYPYLPLLVTYDELLSGIARHMIGWVLGAQQVRDHTGHAHWPNVGSDGQSATSPIEYGTCMRLAKSFDFDRIPDTITGPGLEIVKAFLRTWQDYGAILTDVGQNLLSGMTVAANPNMNSALNVIMDVLTWEDIDFFYIEDYRTSDPLSMEVL